MIKLTRRTILPNWSFEKWLSFFCENFSGERFFERIQRKIKPHILGSCSPRFLDLPRALHFALTSHEPLFSSIKIRFWWPNDHHLMFGMLRYFFANADLFLQWGAVHKRRWQLGGGKGQKLVKLPTDSPKNLPTWGWGVSKILKKWRRCLWMVPKYQKK